MAGIQWFPGHMTKARRELADAMPRQDMVVEVLDARMPLSSENPLMAEIRGDKPCLKVLSKADLADPAVTRGWLDHLSSGQVTAIAVSARAPGEARKQVIARCKAMVPAPSGGDGAVRAMIVGIPNVGKSTLINTLAQRAVAKVSDRPAVTRVQQQIVLSEGVIVSDTPGMTWPKIEDPDASLRLALLGSIPDTAIDHEQVALFGAAYLLARYPERLSSRFKLASLPAAPHQLLEAIGRRRGCLRPGGVVDTQKASSILLHEVRTGGLGALSLERPPGVAAAST